MHSYRHTQRNTDIHTYTKIHRRQTYTKIHRRQTYAKKHRHTDIHKDTHTTDIHTETQTDKHTETQTDIYTKTQTYIYTERNNTDIHKETQTDTQRDRNSQIYTQTNTQKPRQTHRNPDRHTVLSYRSTFELIIRLKDSGLGFLHNNRRCQLHGCFLTSSYPQQHCKFARAFSFQILNKQTVVPFLFVVDHVRIRIKYKIPSYIGLLTMVCRSDACYLPHRHCVVNSYVSEPQTVVNEPIFNVYSYFIS